MSKGNDGYRFLKCWEAVVRVRVAQTQRRIELASSARLRFGAK